MKVFRNKPSMVLICKKSVKAFFIIGIISFVLLILVLIFDLFAYFLTNIGATIVSWYKYLILKCLYINNITFITSITFTCFNRCIYWLWILLEDFYVWYQCFQVVFGSGEKKSNTNSQCKNNPKK